ncbi:MAG: hypothetical protein ACC641_11895 [Acidiferrobacterales bacterium]
MKGDGENRFFFDGEKAQPLVSEVREDVVCGGAGKGTLTSDVFDTMYDRKISVLKFSPCSLILFSE